MLNEQDVRKLVAQVLHQICVNPEYDLIQVTPIRDCHGPSLKFWVNGRDRTLVEGQCYTIPHEESALTVISIYRITLERREPIAETYEARFEDDRLSGLLHGETAVVPDAQLA